MNVLYKQFFETLDSLHNSDHDKKYFGFLATITSHRPWLHQKYDPVLPYPNAAKVEEDFSNIIFRVDSYLKLFFSELNKREYLSNSIVVITGDHSCPANEHGTTLNAVNLYDENCKIPFLMIWKSKLFPKRLTGNAWSQVDIAPTILDLLNIHTNNHFIGHSFLNEKLITGNLVNLVQPYSGLFFSSIIYPYKYVINICDNEESIYNLYLDPGEANNIIAGIDGALLSKLKKEVNRFAINQYLIENNRIWPDSIKNL
jgi:Sulfatase